MEVRDKWTGLSERPAVLRYSVAGVAVLSALGARMALDAVLGTQAPYLLFVLAAAAASRFGGRWPGLLSTALSTLAIDWFFLDPRNSFRLKELDTLAGLALFFLVGVLISLTAPRGAFRSSDKWQPGRPPAGATLLTTPALRQKPHLVWFGLAALILIAEASLFFGIQARYSGREQWSIHTHQVLQKIEALFSTLKDAEAAGGGYLLTGSESYLAPYNEATRTIPAALDELRGLTSDDPGQQARIDKLRPLIEGRLAEARHNIELRRTRGAAAAIESVSAGRGKQLTDRIREVIDAMRAEESSLLARRSAAAADVQKGMGIAMLSGAGFLLLVLFAGARAIDRSIGERYEAQIAARVSEERLEFATTAAGIGVWSWTPGTSRVNVSGNWRQLFGIAPDVPVAFETWRDALHPEDRERAVSGLNLAVEQSREFDIEYRVLLPDGKVRWLADRGRASYDENGRAIAMAGVNIDITERKRAEQELRESEQHYRALFESMHEGFMLGEPVSDASGEPVDFRYLEVNPALARMFQLDRDQIVGRTYRQLFPNPDWQYWVKGFARVALTGEPARLDHYGSGTGIYYETSAFSPRPGRFAAVLNDVSERNMAQEALRESEERFRIAQEASPDGFNILRPVRGEDGRIATFTFVFQNATSARRTGADPKTVVGRTVDEVAPGFRTSQFFEAYSRVAETGETLVFEAPYSGHDDAGPTWFRATVVRMGQDIAALTQDITERKRDEEALRQAYEQLEAIIESIPEPVLVSDGAGNFLRTNSALKRAVPPEKTLGGYVRIAELRAEDGRILEPEMWPLSRALRGERVNGLNLWLSFNEWPARLYRYSTNIIRDSQGNIARAIVSQVDITEQKRTEEELRLSEEKFAKAFATNPAALTITRLEDGLTIDVNEAWVAMMGHSPAEAIGHSVLEMRIWQNPADRKGFVGELKQNRSLTGWEVTLLRKSGEPFTALLSAATSTIAGEDVVLSAWLDISDRKQAEFERQTAIEFLQLVNANTSKDDLIRAAAHFFQTKSGCQAVGIRLKEGEDYPYCEARGFPVEFVRLENSLCTRDAAGEIIRNSAGYPVLECMCGNVIRGRFDPAKPFFTERGSFWTNNTTQLLGGTTEADRQGRTRNRCNGQGYESVALIPVRAGAEAFGLLQLNDRRTGMFSPQIIGLWERLAEYLAVALAKIRAQEALRESEERLRLAQQVARVGTFEWNLQTGVNRWTPELEAMYGLPPGGFAGSRQTWEELVHPEDRGEVVRLVNTSLETGRFEAEWRVIWPDGTHHWLSGRAWLFKDASGNPLRLIGVHIDITERKRAEDALAADMAALTRMHALSMSMLETEELEPLLREIMDAAVAVVSADHGTLQLAEGDSLRIVAHCGHQPAFLEFFAHAEGRASVCGEALKTGERVVVEDVERSPLFAGTPSLEVLRRAGVRAVQSTPLLSRDGVFLGVLTTQWEHPHTPDKRDLWRIDLLARQAADLIEQSLARAALRDSEERFRTLANAIPQLCWMANGDGWIFWYNDGWYRYTGTTPEQMEGWGWQSVHDPEGLPKVMERWKESLATGAPFEMVFPLRGADGVFRPFLTRGVPLRGRDGAIVRWFGTNTDISGQQRAEQALRESEDRLAFALGVSGIGHWDLDLVDHSAHRSLEHDRIFGYETPLAEWTYEMFLEHVLPEDRERVDRQFRAAVETKGEWRFECRITRADGALRWVFACGKHRLDESGAARRMVGVLQDITERKQAEERIRQINTELEVRVRQRTGQLEAANRELEAFAYSVSHDLRAPLRGIDGWSLALVEDYAGLLDERAHKYLDRVRAETQKMGVLIDDLLQLSRVTRSQMESQAVDLSAIAGAIAERLREEHAARQIEFVIRPGLMTAGDPRLLEIALTNLIANAVKFTGTREKAVIEIGIGDEGERPFYIRDNGVGFDMAFAGTLFGAFQRLHKATEFPGTGIGLATVQRIVHRHGGRIWAQARPGQGATFYFTVGAL